MKASHKPIHIQLNPFAFPTETDGHFFLLVMLVAGVSWQLGEWILITFTKLPQRIMTPLALIPPILIFGLAWVWAQRDGQKKIRAHGWQKFPVIDTNVSEGQLLDGFFQNIQTTSVALLELEQKPTFVWDSHNRAITGRAFGFGTNQFILLRRGLLEAFVVARERFEAILLHELGHIANRDVTKTTFSIQLGRLFLVAATIFFLLHNGNAIERYWTLSRSGQSLAPFAEFWPVFIEINIKLLILIAVIGMIRSSVLCIREYYADFRSYYWSGEKRALLRHMQESLPAQQEAMAKMSFIQRWQHRIAPFHPPIQHRIKVLQNPQLLFKPQWKMALFAGLLCGLTFNGTSILAVTLGEEIILAMDTFIPMIGGSSNMVALIFLFLIQIGMLLVYILPPILFGAYPIAKTVGVAVQKAALADRLQVINMPRQLTMRMLLFLSFCLSLGVQTGFLISPFPGAYSYSSGLQGLSSSLPLFPIFIGGWLIIFLTWLLPLRALAGKAYVCHQGEKLPKRKRTWLVVISTLSLLPPLFALSLIQVFVSRLFMGSEDATPMFFLGGIALMTVIGLFGYVLFWTCGWIFLKWRGWLNDHQHQADTATWMQVPPPISFSEVPSIYMSRTDGPPPL